MIIRLKIATDRFVVHAKRVIPTMTPRRIKLEKGRRKEQMGEWIPERNNEHLLSKNGLLDVAVRSEDSRNFTGICRINEAFTVHEKSLDGAKHKILLATRTRLLALLLEVEDVLTGYTEVEKVGDSRNRRKLNSSSPNNLAKGPWGNRLETRDANLKRVTA